MDTTDSTLLFYGVAVVITLVIAAGRIQAAIWAAQEHLQPHLPQDGAA